jgi:hypothetical protein
MRRIAGTLQLGREKHGSLDLVPQATEAQQMSAASHPETLPRALAAKLLPLALKSSNRYRSPVMPGQLTPRRRSLAKLPDPLPAAVPPL